MSFEAAIGSFAVSEVWTATEATEVAVVDGETVVGGGIMVDDVTVVDGETVVDGRIMADDVTVVDGVIEEGAFTPPVLLLVELEGSFFTVIIYFVL